MAQTVEQMDARIKQINDFEKSFDDLAKVYKETYDVSKKSADAKNAGFGGIRGLIQEIVPGVSLSDENKAELVRTAKAAGLSEGHVTNALYALEKAAKVGRKANLKDIEYTATDDDNKVHNLGREYIAERSALYDSKAAAVKLAQEQAKQEALKLRQQTIDSFASTTDIVGKGGIIQIDSNSPQQYAARLEIAKSLEARFALDSDEKTQFLTAMKLKEGEEFKLVSYDGKITNPALLRKALKHFQQTYIPGIVPDALVGTATHQKLLGYEGFSSGIDTASISYHVTQDIGDLGGKRNSYELLTYEGVEPKLTAAKESMLQAKKLMDKLDIKVEDSKAGDDAALAFKEQVQAYQKSRGLKDDGIIGKKTAMAMAQDNLRLIAGKGEEINPDDVKAAVIAATRLKEKPQTVALN